MKRLFLSFMAVAVCALLSFEANAQMRTPAPSPGSTLTQTVGLTDVTIEYSRPGVKGRTIFAADGLVPFGKIWRFGANSATKFTFSEDVKVGGQDLKAGSYAVLAMPNASEWNFHFYTYESGNFGSYLEKEPAAKITVPSNTWDFNVESFTLMVSNVTNTSADINMFWEKTNVTIPLEVHTSKQVTAAFEKMAAGPSDAEYYAYGEWLFNSGGDMEKALKYVRKATAAESPRFWQVRREAEILAKMGKYSDAVAAAQKSMKLAKEANNDDYVRMNEKSIAEWSKM